MAFGLTAGPAPEPFLVGLACLTLLSRAAADQPVLTIVDDVHWIDAESALVLGFVARRLYADRVGMLLTVAETGVPPAFRQLPTSEVGGLPADAAAELLRSVTGTPLEQAVVDRVVADTERNPLALVDVGSHYTAEELAVRAYQPVPIPVGRHGCAACRARCRTSCCWPRPTSPGTVAGWRRRRRPVVSTLRLPNRLRKRPS